MSMGQNYPKGQQLWSNFSINHPRKKGFIPRYHIYPLHQRLHHTTPCCPSTWLPWSGAAQHQRGSWLPTGGFHLESLGNKYSITQWITMYIIYGILWNIPSYISYICKLLGRLCSATEWPQVGSDPIKKNVQHPIVQTAAWHFTGSPSIGSSSQTQRSAPGTLKWLKSCVPWSSYMGLIEYGHPTIMNGIASVMDISKYIYMVPSSVSPPPPHGLGPQVAAPIPFYLQAIGSISEVQLRIC